MTNFLLSRPVIVLRNLLLCAVLLGGVVSISTPQPVSAGIIPEPCTTTKTDCTTSGSGNHTDRIQQIRVNSLDEALAVIWARVKGLIPYIGAPAVLLLIWAGIKYISSGGDTKKTGEARQAIVQIILAIVLVIIASTLVYVFWAIATFLASQVA